MVRIAIAGGSGEVAREVLDALIAKDKHEIVILSRQEAIAGGLIPGTKWRAVDYEHKAGLVEALKGVHTVLSFIQITTDVKNRSQKNLIDAAIAAGVRRFAPSEWGSSGTVDLPMYAGKEEIREYLQQVNANEKVLEYTLFQPGLFLNYLASPHKTARYLTPLNTLIDFEHRRAIVVDGYNAVVTFITVQDLARIVAEAVDYDGEWPVVGGISGNKVTMSQLLRIGERVRGQPFVVDKVKLEDLEAGDLKASWGLETSHKSVSGDEIESMLKLVLIGMLLSSAKGAWEVSEDFNRLLPDYKFTGVEDFLSQVWQGQA